MGGLFGGGGSGSEKVKHVWSEPVDMKGANTPGDDKMRQNMVKSAVAEEQKAAKASKTLLGKTAGSEKMGGDGSKSQTSSAPKTTAVNYA